MGGVESKLAPLGTVVDLFRSRPVAPLSSVTRIPIRETDPLQLVRVGPISHEASVGPGSDRNRYSVIHYRLPLTRNRSKRISASAVGGFYTMYVEHTIYPGPEKSRVADQGCKWPVRLVGLQSKAGSSPDIGWISPAGQAGLTPPRRRRCTEPSRTISLG